MQNTTANMSKANPVSISSTSGLKVREVSNWIIEMHVADRTGSGRSWLVGMLGQLTFKKSQNFAFAFYIFYFLYDVAKWILGF
jgi:hypothetical protein